MTKLFENEQPAVICVGHSHNDNPTDTTSTYFLNGDCIAEWEYKWVEQELTNKDKEAL